MKIVTKQANASATEKTVDDRKAERQAIYNTTHWKRLRKEVLMKNPVCSICGNHLAEHVHHINSFMDYEGQTRIDVAYNSDNLQCVCADCHQKIHHDYEKNLK